MLAAGTSRGDPSGARQEIAPAATDGGAERIAEVTRRHVGAAAAVAAGELALVLAGAAGAPLAVLLAGHVALIVGAAAFLLGGDRGRDLTAPLAILVAVISGGPVGAVVALAALVWLARPALPSDLLADWYRRIGFTKRVDAETRLAERIAAGRVIDTAAPPPPAFEAVMRAGALEERQRALGLVARFFHPGYLPTLKVALASEEPVVRVQAAAVAARVRPQLAAHVARLIGEAGGLHEGDVCRRIEVARDLDRMAASGLLDRPVEDGARLAAGRLLDGLDLVSMPLRAGVDGELLDDLEALLTGRRAFARLRVVRARRRLELTLPGPVRVRRASTPRRAPARRAGS